VDDYLQRVKETLQETAQERERLAGEQREAQRHRQEAEAQAARREKERARIFREELQAAVERYDKALKEQLRTVRDKGLQRKLEREGSRGRHRIQGAMERELGERFHTGKVESFTPPKDVAPGDRVRIPSLGQSGVVESAAAPDRIRVQVEGKTLHVRLADLVLVETLPTEQPSKRRPAARVLFDSSAKNPPGREMNLVGCTVDEALPRLDKFLDEAFLADYETVRLVHGHGTGTLRRAIAEFLKGHPHVANYRLADDREGGTAVTQVQLR
jgi:DNA mismatch repair protein MutS2